MAFAVGQIVRPVWTHPRRNGDMQDWKGYRSAQAWIEVDEGAVLTISAQWWLPSTSSLTTESAIEQCYTLWLWDIESASFVEVGGYPESALEAATIGGVAVAGLFYTPDDGADPFSTALCRSRD